MALVTHVSYTPGKQNEVKAVLVIEGRHINYQVVETRWNASVIKVSL